MEIFHLELVNSRSFVVITNQSLQFSCWPRPGHHLYPLVFGLMSRGYQTLQRTIPNREDFTTRSKHQAHTG